MALSRDPVLEFLSSSKEEINDMNDRDIGDLADEFFEYVEKEDGFPVSTGLWVVTPDNMNNQNSNILSAYLSTGLRSWKINLKTNNFLLLRHWESEKLWINTAYLNAKRAQTPPKSAMGEKPSEFEATGWHRSANKIDILNRFTSPLPNGNYSITQIYYDKKSNTEHFTFSKGNPSSRVNFPKISSAEINDFSINIEIEKADNASTWNLNVIALRLDEDPIIVPFKMDLTPQQKNFVLTLPVVNDGWKKGVYQLYIDGGNQVQGPIRFEF